MRNTIRKVVVFDLDETLGNFVELGIFCDTLEKYNRKKLTTNEFHKIMDIFPEFLRTNIIKILIYLKEQKQKGNLYKVFIYTNNQGPKEWAEKIRLFLEKKINYKLFDKIIAAYKVNGKIIEHTRTTHDKTVADFFRSTSLPKNTEICFLDDLYHPYMDTNTVHYIHVVPYHAYISPTQMAERYYKHFKYVIPNKYQFVTLITAYMNRYKIEHINKSQKNKNEDIEMGKDILHQLQIFIKFKNKQQTRRQSSNQKNISRKNR